MATEWITSETTSSEPTSDMTSSEPNSIIRTQLWTQGQLLKDPEPSRRSHMLSFLVSSPGSMKISKRRSLCSEHGLIVGNLGQRKGRFGPISISPAKPRSIHGCRLVSPLEQWVSLVARQGLSHRASRWWPSWAEFWILTGMRYGDDKSSNMHSSHRVDSLYFCDGLIDHPGLTR